MEKIKNFIHSETFTDILIIIALMIICTFLSGFILDDFLADRGREFLFPQAILNGLTPYKDITVVYFPLSYYVNAFVYKLFGVSFSSIIIFQVCFCTFFMIEYYLLAKEFINRKIAILLSVFIILSCIFCPRDLFSYIIPYAYARIYGIIGGVSCLFFLLKLFKTEDIKYGYIAAIFTGFAMANKIEYVSVIFILIAGLYLYKRLKFIQYIKIFLITMIFPALTILLLYLGGVTIADITSVIKFAIKFSTSPSMQFFLSFIGTTPSLQLYFISCGLFPLLIVSCCAITYCILDKKVNNKFLLLPIFLITIILCLWIKNTNYYWISLPLFIILLSVIFYKDIIKDRNILLLLIATLILSQRELFKLSLQDHGTFSFPLIIILTITFALRYITKYISKDNVEKFITFFLIVLISVYTLHQTYSRRTCRHPLKTNKGTIYLTKDKIRVYGNTLKYIQDNIPKDTKILVLPEGMMFNYISDRKADMHCPMMDRLYYEAYGEEEAVDIIKNANYDYIILAYGFDLSDFGDSYLYSPTTSLISEYIYKNYTRIHQEVSINKYSNILILKKIKNNEE